jgi:ABC-type antimicrobial peptide transport system permease subunit
MAEVKNGWINYVQVPLSIVAYLSIIEILLIDVFPTLKMLSFWYLGIISFIIIITVSYYSSKRIKRIRKIDYI